MKKLFLALFAAAALFLNVPLYALETKSYIPQSPCYALIVIHGYGGSGNSMAWVAQKYKDALP